MKPSKGKLKECDTLLLEVLGEGSCEGQGDQAQVSANTETLPRVQSAHHLRGSIVPDTGQLADVYLAGQIYSCLVCRLAVSTDTRRYPLPMLTERSQVGRRYRSLLGCSLEITEASDPDLANKGRTHRYRRREKLGRKVLRDH